MMGRRLVLGLVLMGGLTGCFVGCAGGPQTGSMVESPMPTETQQAEVLAIAPAGTPRVEALQKLSDAGLIVHQGASETIYYCDVWNRPDGSRWRMDVALLFDKQGNLYRARSANALTSIDDAATTATASTPGPGSVDLGYGTPAAPSESRGTAAGTGATPAGVTPAGYDSPTAGEAAGAGRGQRARTPFGK